MKKLTLLLFAASTALSSLAQTQWINPSSMHDEIIQNQGFENKGNHFYTRIPEAIKNEVSKGVWINGQHSAGLSLYFVSDAPEIKIRYQVAGSLAMPHMPATGVSGISLYRVDPKGRKDICQGRYAFQDTIHYVFPHLQASAGQKNKFEYHVSLPLYNQVKWMEIGIPEDDYFKFIPKIKGKSIVVYGTSIAHGACASTPGMAWTNIMQRHLDCPLINLGFSGNGKLEKGVIDFMNSMDAQLFILDCMPNLIDETDEVIYQKVMDAVELIRSKRDTQILLIEHAGYSNQFTDSTMKERYDHANRTQHKAFKELLAKGIKGLHYLSREELNLSPDAWVDYVHPSDFGMQRQADEVTKKVRSILHIAVK